MPRLSKTRKQEIKDKALTELFQSGLLQKKIDSMCYRYRIPKNADIQSDVLMTTFTELIAYPLNQFIEAYQDNPNRILALAVRISYIKGFAKDTRLKNPYTSIAQKIIHNSSLQTIYEENIEDKYFPDETEFHLEEDDEPEEDNTEMWLFISKTLNSKDKKLLEKHLQGNNKNEKLLTKDERKKYRQLLIKLKHLITEYKTEKENDR